MFPSTAAHLLTDRAEPLVPNAVNLGALPTGLVRSTVTGGIAALTTVPLPNGGLAGLSGPQTLDNTYVPMRTVSLPTNVSPLQWSLTDIDLVIVPELQQNTLIANPIGTVDKSRILWFVVHSTVPRTLTWDTNWSAGNGIPLPTSTSGNHPVTGADITDLLVFMYDPSTGKLSLVYSSQLLPRGVPTVAPGTYTCPASILIDANKQISSITSGTCGTGGGGGSTPAGVLGDIQISNGTTLTADSRRFVHDVAAHLTSTQRMKAGTGKGYHEFTDARGFKGWLFPSDLTDQRAWKLPNKSGTLATLDDILSGGGGNVSSTGTPTTGQAAEWTDTTHVQGVAVTGTGSYVKGSAPIITLPNATGLPLATGVTGTLPGGADARPHGDCTTSAGSLSTTCSKLNGTAFAGTAGNVVSFGATNTRPIAA